MKASFGMAGVAEAKPNSEGHGDSECDGAGAAAATPDSESPHDPERDGAGGPLCEEVRIPADWLKDQGKCAFVLHGVLSPEECVTIMRQTDALFDKSERSGGHPPGHLLSVMHDDAALALLLQQRIAPALGPEFQGKRRSGIFPTLRFLRYDAKRRSNLAAHFDGMTIGEAAKAKSLITLHVYLNTTKGGATRFYDSALGIQGKNSKTFVDVLPSPGSVLVFQQDMYHAGTEVTRGKKYTLRAKMMYA